jgi:hypothetical protein
METETVEQATRGNSVMGAVESGRVERFVLADVTADGAYLTMPLSESASLPAWR